MRITLLFIALLASTVSAQIGSGNPPPLVPLPPAGAFKGTFKLISPAPTELFSRTVILDLDRDSMLDVAVLRGDSVDVMQSPALFAYVSPSVVSGVTDIAAIEVPGEGPRHGLLYSHGAGLSRLDLVEGSWTPTPVHGAAWGSARRIETREIPDDAAPRVFGLLAGGLTVHALIDSGAGYVDTPLFSISQPAIDMAVLEWNGSGLPEVAVMTANRLQVYTYVSGAPGSPQTWATVYSAAPDGFVGRSIAVGDLPCPTPPACPARQWIAWLTDFTPNPVLQAVSIVSQGGSVPAWLKEGMQSSTVSIGDWNRDGSDDLLVNSQVTNSVTIFPNTGSPESGPAFNFFGTSQTLEVAVTIVPVPEIAEAAFADIDNDGFDDLCYPVQATGGLYVNRGGWEDSYELSRLPRFQAYIDPAVEAPLTQECSALRLEITELPSGGPWDAVEGVLFHQPDGPPNGVTNPQSIAFNRVLVENVDEGIVLPLYAPPAFNDLYFFLVWGVQLDALGGVSATGPPALYGLQAQSFEFPNGPTSTTNHAWLEMYSNGPGFVIVSAPDDCEWPIAGMEHGFALSSGAPMPVLPSLPAGQTPAITH